jgi:hypothetical protein
LEEETTLVNGVRRQARLSLISHFLISTLFDTNLLLIYYHTEEWQLDILALHIANAPEINVANVRIFDQHLRMQLVVTQI